jgi:hypothetical protein
MTRDFPTCERERRLVGLGRSFSAGIAALIVVLIAAGIVLGVPIGFGIGWMVFR